MDEAENRTRRINERRIPKETEAPLLSENFIGSPDPLRFTKLLLGASSRFVIHVPSHPDSPINFVEFIERHGTALDSPPTMILLPRARVPVLINVLPSLRINVQNSVSSDNLDLRFRDFFLSKKYLILINFNEL